MTKCYFCQKSAKADGSIFHHPNCAGQSEFSNLQVHRLESRVHELEAEVQRLNMEMEAYRQPLTAKDSAAMLSVIDALQAFKAGRRSARETSEKS